jgi:hypothetical protein
MAADEIDGLPELHYGTWCDRYGIDLEPLYGVELHYRGAVLPDLGFAPIPRDQLAVLTPDEIGSAEFTIDGWLEAWRCTGLPARPVQPFLELGPQAGGDTVP